MNNFCYIFLYSVQQVFSSQIGEKMSKSSSKLCTSKDTYVLWQCMGDLLGYMSYALDLKNLAFQASRVVQKVSK